MKFISLLLTALLLSQTAVAQDSPCPVISVEDGGRLLVAAFPTQTSVTLVGLKSLSSTVKETELLFRWWSGEQDFPYYFHNREGVPRRVSLNDVLFHPDTLFDTICLDYACTYKSSNLIRVDRQLNNGRDVAIITHGSIYSPITNASVSGIEVTWTADNKVASYDHACFSELAPGYSTEHIVEAAHISSGIDYDLEAYEDRKSSVYLGWCENDPAKFYHYYPVCLGNRLPGTVPELFLSENKEYGPENLYGEMDGGWSTVDDGSIDGGGGSGGGGGEDVNSPTYLLGYTPKKADIHYDGKKTLAIVTEHIPGATYQLRIKGTKKKKTKYGKKKKKVVLNKVINSEAPTFMIPKIKKGAKYKVAYYIIRDGVQSLKSKKAVIKIPKKTVKK